MINKFSRMIVKVISDHKLTPWLWVCMVEVEWGEGPSGRQGQFLIGLGYLIFWDSVFSSKMGIMMPSFQDQMKSRQYIFLNK